MRTRRQRRDKNKRRLYRAVQRATFIVLRKQNGIPQSEENVQAISDVIQRILARAESLGWIYIPKLRYNVKALPSTEANREARVAPVIEVELWRE
jgi:hypothetical protein